MNRPLMRLGSCRGNVIAQADLESNLVLHASYCRYVQLPTVHHSDEYDGASHRAPRYTPPTSFALADRLD